MWRPNGSVPSLDVVYEQIVTLPRPHLKDWRDTALLLLMLSSGGRVSEVVNAKWSDWGLGLVRLVTLKQRRKHTNPKTGRVTYDRRPPPVRTVAIDLGQTEAILREYHRRLDKEFGHTEFMFPRLRSPAAQPITRRAVYDIVHGRLGVHPHMLRHVRAYDWGRTLPLPLTMVALGDSTLKAVEVYQHPNDMDAADAIRKLNKDRLG